MGTEYDIICLSPHPDDAVLSCGGSLFAQAASGARVLAVTAFAAGPAASAPISPFARHFHDLCGLAQDGGAQRRAEDIAACRVLGVEHRHVEILDALYRTHPVTGDPLYPTQVQLFGPPAPEESGVVDELVKRFRDLPAGRAIYAPLGVGGHVDHGLVRVAAERCFGLRVRYYEDFPYAWKLLAVRRCVRPARAWQAQVLALDSRAMAAKVNAIAAYASQITPLFGDRARMEQLVWLYARRTGGERFWDHARRAEA